ncbi:MAG: Uma2 family endonuclease [Chloroherpetonaceae bacterium]
MSTVTLTRKRTPKPRYDGKPMTLEHFREWSPEDGFKYEWDNGVLKATSGMKNTERMIVVRLMDAFMQTGAFKAGSRLLPEADTFFSVVNKVRVPDLAYFTREELERSEQGEEPIPKFVIEIISPTNTVNEVQTKLEDYFASGVEVVWEIFPKHKLVRVYRSPKEVKICTGEDMCSAMPAVPDFQLSVNQVFGV